MEGNIIYHFFVVLLLVVSVTIVWSKSTTKVLYFPDPKNEGQLIPAFLEGGPKRLGNESDIHYYLFTTNNPDKPDELFIDDIDALLASNYINGAHLKVMTHGFGGSSSDGFPANLAELYLGLGEDMNVILVDWSVMAESPWYNIAAPMSKFVGLKTAELVSFLIRQNVASYENMHVIGFSLGAQVAGVIGGALGGKVARVTALDPALPLFDAVDDVDRIDPTDGQFVDVVHTAGGYLWNNGIAFMEPRGHVDFYPNSGTAQPGCQPEYFGSCSHGRAPDYFEESVMNNNGFPGCKCENWDQFVGGSCDCSEGIVMGINTPFSSRGLYYFRTASERPYALGIEGTTNGKKN